MAVRIAVIGNINADFVFRVPRLPVAGETLPGSGFFTAPGGKGANQAVAAARLAAEVTFIGCVGDDDLGIAMVGGLAAEGIDVSRVRVDPASHTGTALIMVEDSGENSIVLASGANLSMTPEDIARHRDVLSASDALLLQQEMSVETVAEAARLGREAGCRVILDPAPAQHAIPNLWRGTDVVCPNETEAQALVPDADTSSVAGALACADRMRGAGVEYAAMKLGDKGCVISGPEGRRHLPAFDIVAVDTTAAGDAFTAGLAVALCEGLGQDQAGVFANACGALAAMGYGAQPSLPTRARVEEMVARGRASAADAPQRASAGVSRQCTRAKRDCTRRGAG